jgi:membrane protein
MTKSPVRSERDAEEAAGTGKPSSPMDVHRRSWKFVVKKVAREFVVDTCYDIAASLTFYALLALIPAVMAVVSLVSILGSKDEAVGVVLEVTEAVVSPEAAHMLSDAIDQLAESSVAGVALVIGLLLTIWAGARYVAAFGRGMNRMYRVSEGRRLWTLKPLQILVTIVAMILVAAAIVLVTVSGSVARALGDALGLGEAVLIAWSILRWPVLVFVVILVVALLYYFAPNVKQPRFRWMSLGAAIALVVLVIASAGFGLYVTRFSDYDRVYGSLAGVIIFLLWVWIANMALLVGAEFDAEVERVRELQAGIPAEAQVQLPLRDASRIAKDVRRESEDVAEARQLRQDQD